jgi:hypothetical protein
MPGREVTGIGEHHDPEVKVPWQLSGSVEISFRGFPGALGQSTRKAAKNILDISLNPPLIL